MPQMAPMLWLYLYFFFLLTLIIFISLNYFFLTHQKNWFKSFSFLHNSSIYLKIMANLFSIF